MGVADFNPQPLEKDTILWTVSRIETDSVKLRVICNGIVLLEQDIEAKCTGDNNKNRWIERKPVTKIEFNTNRITNVFYYRPLPLGKFQELKSLDKLQDVKH